MKNRPEIGELDRTRAIAVGAGSQVTDEMLKPEIRRAVRAAVSARRHVPERCRLGALDRIAAPSARAPVTRLKVSPHPAPGGVARAEIRRAHSRANR